MEDLFSELENNNPPSRKLRRGEEKTDIISVSEYLDRLNRDLKTKHAKIVGEVSGFQEYPGRNYLFFTVKDKKDQSTVNCMMWKQEYHLSGVTLQDGLEIIITATPEIYKPTGRFTLKVDMIELVGEGALQIAYEKLKAKLSSEELFEESRKRQIPQFPHKIGVITSKSGAVINDFLSNVGKWGFEILFVDSKVEGADSIKDLLLAVKTLAKKEVDVLVIMRGGGSLESFQAFNNEILVRAVSSFPVPVITGIGHDKDAPLVSMVSDKNVSTPTAVANLLNAGFRDAHLRLKISEQKILSSFENSYKEKMYFLENSERIMEKGFRSIFEKFDIYFQAIKHAKHRIESAIIQASSNLLNISKNILNLAGNSISKINSNLDNMAKILNARNPERQLRLGWSIARNSTGKIVRSVSDVKKGENFEVKVSDGTIEAQKMI